MKSHDLEYLRETIMRLNFSEREAAVYLFLLAKGESSIVSIAAGTDLNRPAVYELLPKMMRKQIISKVGNGKREHYVASHPDTFKIYVERASAGLTKLVDNLSTFAKEHNTSTNVSVFYGKDGIRSVFSDIVTILQKGDIFYRFSNPRDLEHAEIFLPPNYRKLRDEKGLERYIIARSDIALTKKKRLERDIKMLPGKGLSENLTKIIYANRVAYIDYDNERATVLYDQKVADFEKELFMNLWKVL